MSRLIEHAFTKMQLQESADDGLRWCISHLCRADEMSDVLCPQPAACLCLSQHATGFMVAVLPVCIQLMSNLSCSACKSRPKACC